jgi:hypothetical protein
MTDLTAVAVTGHGLKDHPYVITANDGSPKDYLDCSEGINSNDMFEVCIYIYYVERVSIYYFFR